MGYHCLPPGRRKPLEIRNYRNEANERSKCTLYNLWLISFVTAYHHLFPTARRVSFCSQSASWLLGHCSSLSLIRHGRYTSYWNAFLFSKRWQVQAFL